MKPLHMFEKLYVSITYAEERMFENFNFKKLLQNWNEIWVAVAFAEGGIDYYNKRQKAVEPKEYCELGDINCFLTLNA